MRENDDNIYNQSTNVLRIDRKEATRTSKEKLGGYGRRSFKRVVVNDWRNKIHDREK